MSKKMKINSSNKKINKNKKDSKMIKIKINAKINNRFKDKNNKRYIILQLIHKIIEFFYNKII